MKHDRKQIDSYVMLRCSQTCCAYIADNLADANVTEETLDKICDIKYELYTLMLNLFGESQNG